MKIAVRKSLLSEAPESGGMLVGWTVEQYHELISAGGVPESPKAELIDGLLVWKDRATAGDDPLTVGDRHRYAVMRLTRLATEFEAFGCFLQSQLPVVIPPNNEPEPDVAVIRGKMENFRDHAPEARDTIFVLEVADSSLRRDLAVKLPIYAQGGVAIYIVINLQDNVVLIHRKPEEQRYLERVQLRSGDTLQLPTAASQTVDVAVSYLLG